MGRTEGPRFRLDVEALYQALDTERRKIGYTWRQVSYRTGVSASTFTRISQGKAPSADATMALLRWLNVPVAPFVTPNERWEQPEWPSGTGTPTEAVPDTRKLFTAPT